LDKIETKETNPAHNIGARTQTHNEDDPPKKRLRQNPQIIKLYGFCRHHPDTALFIAIAFLFVAYLIIAIK